MKEKHTHIFSILTNYFDFFVARLYPHTYVIYIVLIIVKTHFYILLFALRSTLIKFPSCYIDFLSYLITL